MAKPRTATFKKKEETERKAYELARRLRRWQFDAESIGREVFLTMRRDDINSKVATTLVWFDFQQVTR